MEQYFGEEELPSILQITREDFSDETFVADDFLTKFHQFQTLEDLQKQLQSWDKVLTRELIDVINEDYGDFVGLGNSLSGGENEIEDIKMDILKFQGETKKVKNELDKTIENTNGLIERKKDLSLLEDLAREMILYLKKINSLENRIKSFDGQIDSIAKFGKLFVEIKLLSRDINLKMNRKEGVVGESLIVDETLARVDNIKRSIVKLIDSIIKERTNSNDDLLRVAIVKRKLLETYE